MTTPDFDSMNWTTISEDMPTLVKFENIGDEFIGQFVKTEKIPTNDGSDFLQYLFDDRDGERCAVRANSRLRSAMGNGKVRPGKWVRITYIADIPTANDNPLRDFRVDVAK